MHGGSSIIGPGAQERNSPSAGRGTNDRPRLLKLQSNYGIVASSEEDWLPPHSFFGLTASRREELRVRASRDEGQKLHNMKRILSLSLAFAAAVSIAGCETPQQQNALVGGALGAGTGALIGSAVSGGSAGGALAGAAIGAGSGALIGSAATPGPGYYGGSPGYYGGPPPRRCAQWAYDYNGNRVCTAFY
jgi:hypothetical protein